MEKQRIPEFCIWNAHTESRLVLLKIRNLPAPSSHTVTRMSEFSFSLPLVCQNLDGPSNAGLCAHGWPHTFSPFAPDKRIVTNSICAWMRVDTNMVTLAEILFLCRSERKNDVWLCYLSYLKCAVLGPQCVKVCLCTWDGSFSLCVHSAHCPELCMCRTAYSQQYQWRCMDAWVWLAHLALNYSEKTVQMIR